MRFAALLAASAITAATHAQAPIPQFLVLNAPPGALASFAGGINDYGQVVGQYRTPVAPYYVSNRAFLWDNGVFTTLATVPGKIVWAHYFATDINDAGQISGWLNTGIGDALIWHAPNVASPIPKPPSCAYSCAAHDIDAAGNIVGTACLEPMGYQSSTGFLYTLPDLIGGLYLSLTLNDQGDVAGYGVDSGGHYRAVYWGPNGDTVLNPLAPMSVAEGINKSGQIVGAVGSTIFPNGPQVPVRWDPIPGGFAESALPLPPGWMHGEARRINDQGDVIGRVWNGSGNHRSLLWDASGVIVDLQGFLPAGWTMFNPIDINNWGQICANAIDSAGVTWAVLITPSGIAPPPPPPPPMLVLATPVFGPQQTIVLTATGANPGDVVYFIDDTASQYTSRVVGCPQAPTVIQGPFLGKVTADINGVASLKIRIRPAWSGQTRTFIATDPAGCLISNPQPLAIP
jgi:hypothetical protein